MVGMPNPGVVSRSIKDPKECMVSQATGRGEKGMRRRKKEKKETLNWLEW